MDILKLAREAGLVGSHPSAAVVAELQRFADLVLEEAAKVCDAEAKSAEIALESMRTSFAMERAAKDCAAAIRALKGKP